MQINFSTNKFSKMSLTIIQAPGSDFTGTSLTVLKGAKNLSTDKYFYLLLCLDVRYNNCKSKRPMDMPFYLKNFFTGYLLKFLT